MRRVAHLCHTSLHHTTRTRTISCISLPAASSVHTPMNVVWNHRALSSASSKPSARLIAPLIPGSQPSSTPNDSNTIPSATAAAAAPKKSSLMNASSLSSAMLYRFPPIFEDERHASIPPQRNTMLPGQWAALEESIEKLDSAATPAQYLLKLCSNFENPQLSVHEIRLNSYMTIQEVISSIERSLNGSGNVTINIGARSLPPDQLLRAVFNNKDVSIMIDNRRVMINGGSELTNGVLRVHWLRKNLLAIPCGLVLILLVATIADRRRQRAKKQSTHTTDGGPSLAALAAVASKSSSSSSQ